MNKSETFQREEPGHCPAWLARLREINAAAQAEGRPLPFGGTPKLSTNLETYPSGATVSFTGRTGHGTVTLTWQEG